MKLLSCSLGLLLVACQASPAQETFKIDKISKNYDAVIQVKSCDPTERKITSSVCAGPALVSLYRKTEGKPFQVLNLPRVEVHTDSIAYSPATSENPRQLYEEEYSLVFDDFNFDGHQDLAICNGRNGGYGASSYNVYLFDNRTSRFVENRRLSRLTEGAYLGLFFPDAQKRLLLAFSKSGCCYHETEKYRVSNNHPLLVEKIIEEETQSNAAYLRITTRKLINGKWVTRVRREKLSDQ